MNSFLEHAYTLRNLRQYEMIGQILKMKNYLKMQNTVKLLKCFSQNKHSGMEIFAHCLMYWFQINYFLLEKQTILCKNRK